MVIMLHWNPVNYSDFLSETIIMTINSKKDAGKLTLSVTGRLDT